MFVLRFSGNSVRRKCCSWRIVVIEAEKILTLKDCVLIKYDNVKSLTCILYYNQVVQF